jgi:serine/threonine-protein kinase
MTDQEFFERRVGTILLDKWTLERLIGVGGMAAVYVGRHRIGRRHAIKMLRPEIARNDLIAARFRQEAQTANRLRHSGAVEVLDVDVAEDGTPFLVMELLEGDVLGERVAAREPLPVREVLRIVEQLLDVLAAAHALGIVHRDIKPDNLFVLPGGRLKVIDFGIARVRGEAPLLCTPHGIRMGTLSYMSPEQAAGQPVDARADLFGVGATMVRLLAGRTVHEAASPNAMLGKMATTPAPPARELAPFLSRDVAAVIDRALAFDVSARYPDAALMKRDVSALLANERPPYATEWLDVHERRTARAPAMRAGEVAAPGVPPLPPPRLPSLVPAPALSDPAPAPAPDASLGPTTSPSSGRAPVWLSPAAMAIFVVAASVLAAGASRWGRRARPPAATELDAPGAVLAAAAIAGPSASAESAPPPPAAPSSGGEPVVAPAAGAAESSPPPLTRGQGYLRVIASPDLRVYVGGRPAGATNQLLRVRCGRHFVRLGRAEGSPDHPRWAAPGRTVVVPCAGVGAVVMGR